MIMDQEQENSLSFELNEDVLTFFNVGLKEENITDDIKELINMRFKTKKYYINEKGRKRRVLRVRKYKNDDIRKKIKIKFHKILKNIINKNLKKARSKKFFKYLPSIYTGNISKKLNSKYLDYTYKELLLTDFTQLPGDNKNKKVDYSNYINNKDTIEYLEQNETISKKSGFELIKNLKYKDLFNTYLLSKQFEHAILELKNKNEKIDYIREYVRLSRTYLNYFCSNDNTEDKKIIKNDAFEEFKNCHSFASDSYFFESFDGLDLFFDDYKIW